MDAMVDAFIGRIQGTPDDPCVVLMAGYTDNMRAMLDSANPGLKRRMLTNPPFMFRDYTDQELLHILMRLVSVCVCVWYVYM